MKNMKEIVIRMALLIIAMTSMASFTFASIDPSEMDIAVLPTKDAVILSLANIPTAGAVMNIKDVDGNTLHQEKIDGPTVFNRKYNLKHLADGLYQVSIENETELFTQTININGRKINKVDSRRILKPTFAKKDNSLLVEAQLADSGKYEFALYDADGTFIFGDVNAAVVSVKKDYILENLPVGTYTTIIYFDNESFDYSFSIQ